MPKLEIRGGPRGPNRNAYGRGPNAYTPEEDAAISKGVADGLNFTEIRDQNSSLLGSREVTAIYNRWERFHRKENRLRVAEERRVGAEERKVRAEERKVRAEKSAAKKEEELRLDEERKVEWGGLLQT